MLVSIEANSRERLHSKKKLQVVQHGPPDKRMTASSCSCSNETTGSGEREQSRLTEGGIEDGASGCPVPRYTYFSHGTLSESEPGSDVSDAFTWKLFLVSVSPPA